MGVVWYGFVCVCVCVRVPKSLADSLDKGKKEVCTDHTRHGKASDPH